MAKRETASPVTPVFPMDISFYCFLWRLISVRRVRASNGRQNRFLYRSHRNGQSRKNIVFMRLCGVSGIHFSRRGEQIILLFFMIELFTLRHDIPLQSIKKESLKWRIANYGFREMTYDIDAVITASSARMEAVNAVGDRLSLPNG